MVIYHDLYMQIYSTRPVGKRNKGSTMASKIRSLTANVHVIFVYLLLICHIINDNEEESIDKKESCDANLKLSKFDICDIINFITCEL